MYMYMYKNVSVMFGINQYTILKIP
jgi:hypothetical protein